MYHLVNVRHPPQSPLDAGRNLFPRGAVVRGDKPVLDPQSPLDEVTRVKVGADTP